MNFFKPVQEILSGSILECGPLFEAPAVDAIAASSAPTAAEAAALRFFFNGIKGPDGKLQRCHYSAGTYTELSGIPAGTITIYARDYSGFSGLVWETFSCKNDTDMQSDYFVKDTARVVPSHPLYAAVKAALDAGEAKFQAMLAAREVKYAKQKAARVAMDGAPASARVN